jgi:hypothetical protein
MPLVSDLKVEDGEFSWDRDVPGGGVTNFTHSPIDYHDNVQVVGTPFFDDDRFIIKFNNVWTIETPAGYSLLFTHPFNRGDLPFTTIAGMVDADSYTDNLITFPARCHDSNFGGVLPKGTRSRNASGSNANYGPANARRCRAKRPSACTKRRSISPTSLAFTGGNSARQNASGPTPP